MKTNSFLVQALWPRDAGLSWSKSWTTLYNKACYSEATGDIRLEIFQLLLHQGQQGLSPRSS